MYDFYEFKEAMERIFGVSEQPSNSTTCKECGGFIMRREHGGHDFKTCPLCGWDVETAVNNPDEPLDFFIIK